MVESKHRDVSWPYHRHPLAETSSNIRTASVIRPSGEEASYNLTFTSATNPEHARLQSSHHSRWLTSWQTWRLHATFSNPYSWQEFKIKFSQIRPQKTTGPLSWKLTFRRRSKCQFETIQEDKCSPAQEHNLIAGRQLATNLIQSIRIDDRQVSNCRLSSRVTPTWCLYQERSIATQTIQFASNGERRTLKRWKSSQKGQTKEKWTEIAKAPTRL